MYLGIEIGGTKLQLAVGLGQTTALAAIEQREIDTRIGADGILELICQVAKPMLKSHAVEGIGIGFGGPVLADSGRVIKSHQVAGWDDLPLSDWCQRTLGRPAVLGNDCDVAAFAEAQMGAGQGHGTVFYVTVGTGIGGGLVIDGRLHGAGRPAVAEIGHLRPGPEAATAEETVESRAAGPAIAAAAAGRLARPRSEDQHAIDELLGRCHGNLEMLTARVIGQAAVAGNELAQDVLRNACRTLGWAIAQAVTLVSPDVVVVGGGVSMIGEEWFFRPLRESVSRYVFPPLATAFQIVPAQLGQLVVVHGALALARRKFVGQETAAVQRGRSGKVG